MICNFYLRCFVILCFGTINASLRYRQRRQVNPLNNIHSSYQGRSAWPKTPSGSIPGTYYYGVGSDPNYGSFIAPANRPNTGVFSISYDPNSNLNGYLINSNHQQHQSSIYNTNNNAWSRPNSNTFYNQPSNRYPSGSQGWYATGGNYGYNNGQSVAIYPCLLTISMLILIMCT